MQARIVSAERQHLFWLIRSVPPEKALSIGVLVAKINLNLINLKKV